VADDAIIEDAWAKVNLSLQITGRRPDGYHEMESLVVFAAVGDRLRFTPAEETSLMIEGPFAAALAGDGDNLVLRAARALAKAVGCDRGAAMTLTKSLPVASGIGGGSADAAAALRGLLRLWDCSLPPDDLAALALGLGADVPVCLGGRPVMMAGIGERLAPLPALPPLWLLLVNPGVAISTAAVFGARQGGFSTPPEPHLPPVELPALLDWLARHGNDLEPPARRLAPAVAEVLACLEELPACRLARMSGSGATCFGIFQEAEAARAAEAALRQSRPGWWAKAAPLLA
jgi:4-diphosphocytidyl-2-C-methyl-D-erythritol kinase